MARILRKMVITKRVSVTAHYINSRPSVQAWRAFCCEFPAFCCRWREKTGSKGRMCSKWSPWSAGCGSCGAKWCFVRWLQFGRNLEELAHGVRPGHADILVLEHEEISIPRPGLCLSFFRNKSRIAFLGTAPVSITSAKWT